MWNKWRHSTWHSQLYLPMFIYGLPTDVPLIWPSIPIFSEKVLGTSNKANYTLRFLVLHDFFGEKSQTRFLETHFLERSLLKVKAWDGNQTRPLWWYVSCKRHEDLVHGIGYAGPRGFPSPRREKREREAARESLFWIWSARAHIPRLLFDLKSHQALEGSWVINNMAEDFVGAKLRITTSDGSYIGIVHSIDTKKRKLTLTKGQDLLVTRLNWCVLNCWIGTFV